MISSQIYEAIVKNVRNESEAPITFIFTTYASYDDCGHVAKRPSDHSTADPELRDPKSMGKKTCGGEEERRKREEVSLEVKARKFETIR